MEENFIFDKSRNSQAEEIISSFIKQFYMSVNYVPKELVVDTDFEDMQIMSDWLSSKKGPEGSNNST